MRAADLKAQTLTHVAAEWSPHAALWTAWPSHAELWQENLQPARAEVSAMVLALAAGEPVKVIAMGAEAIASAQAALGNRAEIVAGEFGDIWLRDTGPIFSNGSALRFRTNGWGGKYDLPHDDTVGDAVATVEGWPVARFDFILEGGAVEHDGCGTILTTRQCLLNPNRNPGWTEADAETVLGQAFGARRILWLDDGLQNDHTDGHIDNVARFVAPGLVVCQTHSGEDDPNDVLYSDVAIALRGMTDATGQRLNVLQIPSPGRVVNDEGEVVPASHMNFVIGNGAVVVPVYNEYGAAAVEALRLVFPGRTVVGVPSRALLSGGGAFHCITQQVPA